MATLIQSKQIEGVVTASVIQGDFQASGDISASIISASQIVGVKYGDIEGTPNFVGGSGITITQVGDTYTFTNTGGGGVGDGISDAASILQLNAYTASNDLVIQRFEETTSSLQTQITSLSSSLSNIEIGTTDFSELTGVPIGLVSSSVQVLGGSDVVSGSVLRTLDGTGVLSGSKSDISHLNQFTSSIQSQVDELILSSSTFITSETDSQTLTIVGDQLTISSGNTITIPTGSSGGVSSWNELTDIPSGLISGSYVESLPSGLVSSSDQVLGGTGILSGSKTDITSLNDYTSSTDSRLTNIESTTTSLQSQIDGIVHTQIPEGTISSSAQITALGFISESVSGTSDFNELTNVPSGLVSSSDQILGGSGVISGSVLRTLDGTGVLSGSKTDISSLNEFTSSYLTDSASFDTRISNIGDHVNIGNLNEFTQSAESRLSQLESATGSYLTSETDNQTLTIVGDQLTISDGNTITIPTGSNVTLPSGLISSSDQILGGSGILSGSHTDITSLNQFTSSVQTEIDGLSSLTSSYLTELPTDLVSGSVLRTLDGTGVLSGSKTDISSLNDFTSSIQTEVDGLSSQTSSYLTELPSGLFSGSILPGDNVTIDSSSGDYIISASIVGGGDTSFDGNREVTNTLLGDLFTESFNAGTSGSIQDFLDAMFFPSYAPTATFTTQTSNLNTNLTADGTVIETISITDTVDDSPYVVTISGDDSGVFRVVPTNADSSSWEIQSIDGLIAGTFTYDITVSDKNSASRTYSGRSVEILQANAGTLSTTGTLYIIESATTGPIYLGSNGRGGSQGGVSVSYSPNYGTQSARNFTSSNPLISINSSTGVLSVGDPIKGSGNLSGSTITTTIGWNDQYGNSGTSDITVNVTQNNAPDIQFSNSSRLNTNQAVNGGGTLVTISFSDTEGDSINHDSFQFTDTSGQLTATKSGNNYLVTANSNLSGSTSYTIGTTIEDVHGFRSNTESHTFTIVQSGNGTISGDTTIYIVESALTGDSFRDATGFGAGNTADVNVTYSPSAGGQSVQSFSSSRPAILINSSGNMTLGVDLSGSVINTDYTSTAIETDSTNSTLYGKSLYSHGLKIVQGAAVGGQTAVPDLFTEKVAQVVKLMITGSGPDIDAVAQANMIGTLKGESGTWHSGYPTAQRILRGAGSDYSPNPLIDSNYSSYSGLQNFQDTHSTNDMVWYLNSSATPGSGDADITEVMEHLMHTIHLYGVRGGVEGSVNGLSWMPDLDSDWNTRELYLALKEAVDNNVFDISGYGDGDYTTAATFELAAKEYLYLLNFNMWEYSSLWDGGSLSPEWNDNSRTQSGIQTYNPLGYALYNKYIKPVLTKPSLSSLRSIFQDGDVGNPAIAGSSGYTPEVGSSLISKITFQDQYGNIGSGSVTANVFGNLAPSVSFVATSDYNTDNALANSNAGVITISDTETNSPYNVTLSGTNGDSFNVVPQNDASSSWQVQPTGSLSLGTYSIDITVTDNYGEVSTLSNKSIVVSSATDYGVVYVYTSTFGSDAGFSANYLAVMGGSTVNSDTPPEVTAYSANTLSPFFTLKGGSIGDSSITLASSTSMTLRDTISGDVTLDSALQNNGSIIASGTSQVILVYPSGSDMEVPTSIQQSINGVSGGGVPYMNVDSAGWGIQSAQIHSIILDTPHLGYTEWFVLGRQSRDGIGSSFEYRIVNANGGSAPS